ncbi:MAG: hypothetical protein NTZ09_20390, partial [Candidatus Hydrogenedentes bacterium]|nr:hypothetical protein [Candidatus Hydrogenedentota bacterium]
IPPVVAGETGSFTLGSLKLYAELDPQKPARLSAELASASLYVNALPSEVFGQKISAPLPPSTLLAEMRDNDVSVIISGNMPPVY